MAKTLRSEIADKFGGAINRETLARYVERIEAMQVDRDAITGDMKEVFEEAKNAGFVPKILRQIIRERRMEEAERHDYYAAVDNYRRGLDMIADLPLGDAAIKRAAAESAPKPRPFADQPLSAPRARGRPRKTPTSVDDALDRARLHLGEEEPAGTA